MADPVLSNAIRVNAVLQNATGLPEDRYVSSFVFTGIPAGGAALAAICVPLVEGFYNGVWGGRSIASHLGPQCSRVAAASKLIWYDLSQAPVRTPHEVPFTLGAAVSGSPGSEALPAEVALVLSLQTTLNSGRGRGRVYVGPFNMEAALTGADHDCHPTGQLRTTVAAAAAGLADGAVAGGCSWQVLSRAGGFITEITGGFVDDAWDTQRRRGRAPSGRLPWVVGL
jgi:hypothetical protein